MIMENNVNKTYGLAVQAVHTENGQDIVIQNQNHFRINEIVVTVTSTVSTTTDTPVTDNATASDCVCVQKKRYYIVSLAAGEIAFKRCKRNRKQNRKDRFFRSICSL